MPSQMPARGADLAALGFEMDPQVLGDPTASPLSSVVSLGGCSASFVSEEGLVITNHHCVTRALQHNSTATANLLTDGFLAKDRGAEKWAGPTARVFVTQRIEDITATIVRGLDDISDGGQRFTLLEKRTNAATNACERDRPGVRCRVASYFRRGPVLSD